MIQNDSTFLAICLVVGVLNATFVNAGMRGSTRDAVASLVVMFNVAVLIIVLNSGMVEASRQSAAEVGFTVISVLLAGVMACLSLRFSQRGEWLIDFIICIVFATGTYFILPLF
ncbi:hypothetical protein [Achromobacter sp. UMC46]|uniref:hypothetical protein n=1 Tax=Achromobacter sp. UMC46 TaxID=1862319 RepID=UPI0015FFC402|nr:hypothetical protein [Achromobacter sp. UMC46]MBB1597426.1 hypothetical protein [Achromobacter sp. UMC46]